MHNKPLYRVPDILDKIYQDIVWGLYSSDVKSNRIIIAKCNLACDILVNTSCSESEIVDMVDLPSLNEFRKQFKNFTGIYPLEFRKRFSN